ncbi:MAG: hypothetical protein AMXMBFR4_07480 [Candidatus Hydrogenedentota bacterium]
MDGMDRGRIGICAGAVAGGIEMVRSFGWIVAVSIAGLLVFVSGIEAQGGAKFTSRERIAETMDSNPEWVVSILETILSSEQAAEFERALFPPVSGEEQKRRLEAVKTQLLRLGLSDSDPLVQAVAARADAIAVEGVEVAGDE